MHWRTHLYFGIYIYKKYLKNTDINKLYFLYGNIKPDIRNTDIPFEHSYKDSIDYLDSYLHYINNSQLNKKDLSISLGVICHFISDYFCYYHSTKDKLNLSFSHYIYELKLHYTFLYMLLFNKTGSLITNLKFTHFKEIMYNIQKSYLKIKPNAKNDVNYALTSLKILIDFHFYHYFNNLYDNIIYNPSL